MIVEGKIIHLEKDIERLDSIQTLQTYFANLCPNLTVTFANDGSHIEGLPTRHPFESRAIRKGEYGCCLSHVEAIRSHGSSQPLLLLEDDAQPRVPSAELEEWIRHVDSTFPNWEILLLGANEQVNSEPLTSKVQKVDRFWGTHAMIFRPSVIPKILQTLDQTLRTRCFYPADWLYNEAIRQHNLLVLGPVQPKLQMRQIPGMISSITGKPRPA